MSHVSYWLHVLAVFSFSSITGLVLSIVFRTTSCTSLSTPILSSVNLFDQNQIFKQFIQNYIVYESCFMNVCIGCTFRPCFHSAAFTGSHSSQSSSSRTPFVEHQRPLPSFLRCPRTGHPGIGLT